MNNAISLLWLAAVLVAIPVVLWLLKRTPLLRGQHAPGAPRTVASLPLSPNQRVVTVEVGQGGERQWLVLGVGPQGITTLHTMPAGSEALGDGAIDITKQTSSTNKDLLASAARSTPRSSSRAASGASPASTPKDAVAAKGSAPAARSGVGSATSATFAQLLQRLRTPAASAGKRGPGKPPRDSKPGNHGR
jgi:flagellar protein FliO/FliZ